jgi:hypothetical protein
MKGGDIFVLMISPAAGSSANSMDIFTSLILGNIAFIFYGGLHLLAWRYHFRSTAESILWKMAGVLTTSSGAVALVLGFAGIVCGDISAACRSSSPTHKTRRLIGWVSDKGEFLFMMLLMGAWMIANMIARAYLFVESFVALPNSPPSNYHIPRLTAYVAHI